MCLQRRMCIYQDINLVFDRCFNHLKSNSIFNFNYDCKLLFIYYFFYSKLLVLQYVH